MVKLMHYLKFLCAKEIVFFFLTKGVFMFRSIKWFAQDSTAIGGKSLDLWPPYLLNSIFVSFKSSKCNEHESMNTTETAISVQFSCSVQFSSVAQSCPTLHNPMNRAARQASLSITNSRSSLKLTSIESVVPSSHLILCHPLLLLPPIPPSIRVFQ